MATIISLIVVVFLLDCSGSSFGKVCVFFFFTFTATVFIWAKSSYFDTVFRSFFMKWRPSLLIGNIFTSVKDFNSEYDALTMS